MRNEDFGHPVMSLSIASRHEIRNQMYGRCSVCFEDNKPLLTVREFAEKMNKVPKLINLDKECQCRHTCKQCFEQLHRFVCPNCNGWTFFESECDNCPICQIFELLENTVFIPVIAHYESNDKIVSVAIVGTLCDDCPNVHVHDLHLWIKGERSAMKLTSLHCIHNGIHKNRHVDVSETVCYHKRSFFSI